MKKTINFIMITLFCTLTISAQMRKERSEKIKALKIAYLTEQLALTADEAQKFWPVYNTFDKQQSKLRNAHKANLKKVIKKNGTIDGATEEEAKKLIASKLDSDKKLHQIKKDFIDKIKSVISYKKILKLQVAEMEFGRKLMRKYKRKGLNSRN